MDIIKMISNNIDDIDELEVVEILTQLVNNALDEKAGDICYQENDEVVFLKDLTIKLDRFDKVSDYLVKKGTIGTISGKSWQNAYQPVVSVCMEKGIRPGLGIDIIVKKRDIELVYINK